MEDIRIILMDVDGVLTDGSLIYGEKEEFKVFNVHDGMGIELARKAGLRVGFISGRKSKAVERRAKELNIDYLHQDCTNKLEVVNKLLKKENLNLNNACYIGDDINDMEMIKTAGIGIAMGNALDDVKAAADFVCDTNDNDGVAKWINRFLIA